VEDQVAGPRAKLTATMASILAVANETENSMSRVTKDGRQLTYELKVIQQPERARACGSGAKCTILSAPIRIDFRLTS